MGTMQMNNRITIAIVALAAVLVAASALGLGSPASGPDLPTVVSISEGTANTNSTSFRVIYRQWSDGRLDAVRFMTAGTCGGPAVICVIQYLPGMTTYADVDRDGVVGVTDFLAVLAAWDSGS